MNSDDIRALSFATMDDGEELARAEAYGLLARLWFSPPDDELLQQFGVAVTFVVNGREAADAWASKPWDVILMDIQMPVMSGVEATRLIRKQEALTQRRSTPIIALTANTMTHQLPEYENAGFSGVVAKPIQVGLLMQALLDTIATLETDAPA